MKYKSYAFWTSLSAAAVVAVGTIAKAFGLEISEKIVSDMIMGVCAVLVVLGVVKMPQKNEEKQTKESQSAQNEKEKQEKEQICDNADTTKIEKK